jgi:CRP-like cAMP-binding protein
VLAVAANQLLELLPGEDRQRLLRIATEIELKQSEVLGEAGKPLRHVYFPITGWISLVTSIGGKPVLEVGMVGREGMFGAQIVLQVLTQPFHALVQGSGSALKVPIESFRTELNRSAALRDLLGHYVYALMTQLASSAACTRFHQIDARLGRWLLMMQDRAQNESFAVTHVFLSYMLGVRRVGITIAAGALQKAALIEYRRGKVTVLNRKGLEHAACSCYRDGNEVYARMLVVRSRRRH